MICLFLVILFVIIKTSLTVESNFSNFINNMNTIHYKNNLEKNEVEPKDINLIGQEFPMNDFYIKSYDVAKNVVVENLRQENANKKFTISNEDIYIKINDINTEENSVLNYNNLLNEIDVVDDFKITNNIESDLDVEVSESSEMTIEDCHNNIRCENGEKIDHDESDDFHFPNPFKENVGSLIIGVTLGTGMIIAKLFFVNEGKVEEMKDNKTESNEKTDFEKMIEEEQKLEKIVKERERRKKIFEEIERRKKLIETLKD